MIEKITYYPSLTEVVAYWSVIVPIALVITFTTYIQMQKVNIGPWDRRGYSKYETSRKINGSVDHSAS